MNDLSPDASLSSRRVPRRPADIERLLAERPLGWAGLYFAGVLYEEKEALSDKVFDHELGYSRPSSFYVEEVACTTYLQRAFEGVEVIMRDMETLIDEKLVNGVISAEPADPRRLHHLAVRWASIYERLLDWAAELRGLKVPPRFRPAFAVLAHLNDGPIRQYGDFLDEFIDRIDQAVPTLVPGERKMLEPVKMTLKVDPHVLEVYKQELVHLANPVANQGTGQEQKPKGGADE